MKRIALIQLGVDGAGPVYALEMAKALVSQGNVLLAIVSKYSQIRDLWRAVDGVELYEMDTYTSRTDFLQKSVRIDVFYKLWRKLKKFEPEIVYSPMSDLWQPFIFKWLIPSGVCRVKTVHDPKPHLGEDGFIMRLYHAFSYRDADKIVVLSKVFVPVVVGKGIKEENVIVVPHPNFDFYVHSNNLLSTPSKIHNKILFFGRIIKYKGLDILLEAMKIVVTQMPHLKLVIAGAGDTKPYANLLGELEENLELHLYQIPDNEVEKLFNACDYVVLPYTEASQSGVIPLAYSFAKPVIASAVGGIPEQVTSGTGMLVEAGNVDELAAAIIDLSGHPNQIWQLGLSAKTYADNELTWAAAARSLVNAL